MPWARKYSTVRRMPSSIETFLGQLDSETREIFELADIEGMNCPEVARALELDLHRVLARLKTARRRNV